MLGLTGFGGQLPFWALLLILTLVALAAGALGGLLGLGGGLFLVPVLVIAFGLDIHLAIAASLVSVTGTSSGAAAVSAERRLADLRIGTFLEAATVLGGVLGALVAVTVLGSHSNILVLAFVPVVLLSAYLMLRGIRTDVPNPEPPNGLARRLRLWGTYVESSGAPPVPYVAKRLPTGFAIGVAAGLASGLLGVGGGVFKVPAMNGLLGVPLRVAIATSNYMLGITAAAGAIVYLVSGDVVLGVVAPVAAGTLVGSFFASRFHARAQTSRLKALFVVVLGFAALFMLLRGLGVIA